jgi:hypothetical protein
MLNNFLSSCNMDKPTVVLENFEMTHVGGFGFVSGGTIASNNHRKLKFGERANLPQPDQFSKVYKKNDFFYIETNSTIWEISTYFETCKEQTLKNLNNLMLKTS